MDKGSPVESHRPAPSELTDENLALRERIRELEREAGERGIAQKSAHDDFVLAIARGISSATGQSFFRALVGQLAVTLEADYAFIGRISSEVPLRVRTLALFVDGREVENLEYDLCGTPCEGLLSEQFCLYPRDVQQRFPEDRMLVEMGAQSYVGTPLHASDGRVLGLMALLQRKPLADTARVESLLRLFAVRAAAELERLQAEEKLRRSETLLRSILDHTTAVISVKHPDGRYLLVNREFERVFEARSDALLERTCHDLLPPEEAERVRANDLQVQESRSALQREETVTLPNGEQHTFLAAKVPLFDAEGVLMATCGISTDITEHKRLEAQLVQAQRMESIGQLAGGIAHDFNNLLTAIIGYTTLALDSLPMEHPARVELGQAQRASDRATTLTRQLLVFARKQRFQLREVDLRTLLHDIQSLLRPVIGEHIRLRLQVSPGLWNVFADPGQLEQVLMNLAVNARDAMPGGGTLELTAGNLEFTPDAPGHPGGLRAGSYVELRVHDSGHGIPDDIRAHIFEPFFTTKGVGQGTGLGLATCHGIIEQSGGHIRFESRAGEGTTFIVLLPRGTQDQLAAPSPRATHAVIGWETLLVVEDDAPVRELAVRSLQAAGFRVLEASDGDEALAVASRCPDPIALLVTDVVMPGMNGLELADRLRAVRPGTRVLLLSGYPDSAFSKHEQEPAAWPLLNKPYTPLELSTRVRETLDALGG